jgi:NCS1 family nucleobase:cation symporter-1
VFLSSIAGVIICDYYIVRKGYLDIKALYSARSQDPYFYWFGWSWRGYTAYICGIFINIVGFVGAIGKKVPIGATYIYNVNFFAGFIVASGIYYLLCRYFPIPATSDHWHEVGDEIGRNLSVVYVEAENYDEENTTGFDGEKETGGVHQRKVATDF